MQLIGVEVKNYRSLGDVKVKGFGKLNVLIGRNNTGKSSIISAIRTVADIISGTSTQLETVLTDANPCAQLHIKLEFILIESERLNVIELLCRHGYPETLRESLIVSQFARQLHFSFLSHIQSNLLHIERIETTSQNGELVSIQARTGEPLASNPVNTFINWESILKSTHSARFLDGGGSNGKEINFSYQFATAELEKTLGEIEAWPVKIFVEFMRKAFFFNPFRHSAEMMSVNATDKLMRDGSNLTAVLHTINSNNRPKYGEIENFIHTALPDIGTLQSPLYSNSTKIGFRSEFGHVVHLQDMGGGIEQLLMVATVLLTTGDESPIFLEEPESHLHPGAQRFLIENLTKGDRQIFLTTHSPVFVNVKIPCSLYQVTHAKRRTSVKLVDDVQGLGTMLQDIGVRNSDVLLSDAILFVEGRGDEAVFTAWSETLQSSFAEHNVTVLTMGGGETADHDAPIRSELLENISKQSAVPHLFILDRDERHAENIQKLETKLGSAVHFLACRELENYMLSPNAILEAMAIRGKDSVPTCQKLRTSSKQDIESLINSSAKSLYGRVLVKRVRWKLEKLAGGPLSREMADTLARKAGAENFGSVVESAIRENVDGWFSRIKCKELVDEEKKRLDLEWADGATQRRFAPGEEILAAVFREFDLKYDKSVDGLRIAKAMKQEDIHDEIKGIIAKAVKLTQPT